MGFASLQSLWAFYLGILAETPNPFPVVKGCVCFVGSASCRAFGHTRPASVPGLSVGLPPSPRLGLRPKPHFLIIKRFIDSVIAPEYYIGGSQFVEKFCFCKKVLVLNPYPQTPFPGKGAILLGLPPLDPVGGYAPKQGCFGCLPKVLHDAKPT